MDDLPFQTGVKQRRLVYETDTPLQFSGRIWIQPELYDNMAFVLFNELNEEILIDVAERNRYWIDDQSYYKFTSEHVILPVGRYRCYMRQVQHYHGNGIGVSRMQKPKRNLVF